MPACSYLGGRSGAAMRTGRTAPARRLLLRVASHGQGFAACWRHAVTGSQLSLPHRYGPRCSHHRRAQHGGALHCGKLASEITQGSGADIDAELTSRRICYLLAQGFLVIVAKLDRPRTRPTSAALAFMYCLSICPREDQGVLVLQFCQRNHLVSRGEAGRLQRSAAACLTPTMQCVDCKQAGPAELRWPYGCND